MIKSNIKGGYLLNEEERRAMSWLGAFIINNYNIYDKNKMILLNNELLDDTELSEKEKDIVKLLIDW